MVVEFECISAKAIAKRNMPPRVRIREIGMLDMPYPSRYVRPNRAPRSFGGGELKGEKLVHFVYLDEAGISNRRHEPVMTVAGVMVHADGQFKRIERHLDDLIERYIPNRPVDFCFHAYELFGGMGYFSDREAWPLESRLEILDALAAIPKKFNLPVCHCSADREEAHKSAGGATPQDVEMVTHAHAFFQCAVQVELIMRSNWPREVAMMTAEDRPEVKKLLKLVNASFRGRGRPDLVAQLQTSMKPAWGKFVPFENVVETVQFAQKTESSLLQIADTCAFAIKRWVARKPHSDRLFKPIAHQFMMGATQIGFGPIVNQAPWHEIAPKALASAAAE